MFFPIRLIDNFSPYFCVSLSLSFLYVGATAIDALSAGYRVILIDDCCRGVDLVDIEKTKQTVISSNGVIVHSNEVCTYIFLSS